MTKQRIIVVSVSILIVLILLAYFADRACHIPRHREALQISKAGGCFEFWINRYQSAWTGLIGASAALFSAWLAWSAIQGQIKQQERATTISEISYWQEKVDFSENALYNIEIIELSLNLISVEIGEIKNCQNTAIAVIRSLERKGDFPLTPTNAPAVGTGGYSFNQFVHIVHKLYDSTNDAGHEMLIEIDRNLQRSFSHIPAILMDVQKSKSKHERTMARASRALEGLESISV